MVRHTACVASLSDPVLHHRYRLAARCDARYRAEGAGSDVGFFLGGGIVLYLVWLASTAAGVIFSNWLTNPRAFGIDLLLPIFFATLLIPGLARRAPRGAVAHREHR